MRQNWACSIPLPMNICEWEQPMPEDMARLLEALAENERD